MSKKIYKGYELIKAIADGEIKEGSRFIDNYTEYIYEKDKLCNEELTLYRKDVFTGIWESPDYSLFVDNENEFELIEENTINIETVNAYKLIESPYMAECLRDDKFDIFVDLLKQSELELVDKINRLVDKVKEMEKTNAK